MSYQDYMNWFNKHQDKLIEEFEKSGSNDWKGFVNDSYRQYQESKGE